MAANLTDKITDVRKTTRPNSTTVSVARNAGAITMSGADLSGWPTTTESKVHFVTYQVDTDGNVVTGTQCDWEGIVSGNTVSSLTLNDGTDTGNSVGDIMEMLPTAAWGQDLADALTTSLNRTGTLKDGAVSSSSMLASSVVSSDKIASSAVTTAKVADSAITTAKVNDSAITPAKRSGGFATGTLTPSATGNLATTGLGFSPTMVEFTWLPSTSTTNSQQGVGVMTSSAQSTTSSAEGATFSRYSSTSNCISCLNPSSSAPFQLASYVSMDSDGFTVNFSAQGGAQISWKAYR